jgi:succinate dehydrogenase/fumarate reductase flavoprotein subunit
MMQDFSEEFLKRSSGENPFVIREELGKVMWDHAGIVRSGEKLKRAIKEIEAFKQRVNKVASPGGRSFNLGWQQALDLRNLLTAAELIARSALMREDSRGAHYREDFPRADDTNWLKNIYATLNAGELKMWTEPVKLERLKS